MKDSEVKEYWEKIASARRVYAEAIDSATKVYNETVASALLERMEKTAHKAEVKA